MENLTLKKIADATKQQLGRLVCVGGWDNFPASLNNGPEFTIPEPTKPNVIPITGVGIPERSTRARAA
jgi:hypothetical protein